MSGFAEKPSNYDFLKKLRSSENVNLKPCSFLRPETKLRSYQAVGALHFIALKRFILGDGVGLGKTVQAVAGYAHSREQDPSLKLLIVTPKSATEQWAEEIHKFCSGISTHILSNKYAKAKDSDTYGFADDLKSRGIKCKILRHFAARKAQYDTVQADALIVGYSAVQNDFEFLIANRMPNFMVVFDEVQEIKNHKTKTHMGAEAIASKATRVYGLSATVIKNKLEEAYRIYSVIVPGLFPGERKFFKEFTIREKKSRRIGKFKKRYFNVIVGYKNLAKFKETIDPYFLIRRTREVANELPRLVSRKVVLEMGVAQDKLYKQALSGDLYRRLIRDRYFEFENHISQIENPTEKELKLYEKLKNKYDESLTPDGIQKNKIAALSYCQLVSNGPGWLGEEGESSKEKEFERLFDQELAGEKVIVFTRFKNGIARLQTILDNLGIKNLRITGDESAEQRRDARRKFQDLEQDYEVIFITTAGSAAINLQTARVVLFYDTPWSYGDLYQTIGRAQRIGSVHSNILLLHMVNKKTIDEHVLKVLEGKKDLITTIMGDIAEGAVDFSGKGDEVSIEGEEGEVDALFSSVFGG